MLCVLRGVADPRFLVEVEAMAVVGWRLYVAACGLPSIVARAHG